MQRRVSGRLLALLGVVVLAAGPTVLLDATWAAGVIITPVGASVAMRPYCEKPLVIGVPGSDESSESHGYGRTVLTAVGRFKMAYRKSVTAEPLDYTASAVTLDLLLPGGLNRYKGSVDNGITTLKTRLNFAASQCPSQPIVLIGFSQGALVINRTLATLDSAIREQIAAVELIADPQRLGTVPYTKGSAKQAFSGISVSAKFYPPDDLPAEVQGRTDSYCQDGDLVCAADLRTVAAVVSGGLIEKTIRIVHAKEIHLSYPPNGIADQAGKMAAGRLKMFLRQRSRQTPPTTTTTVPPPAPKQKPAPTAAPSLPPAPPSATVAIPPPRTYSLYVASTQPWVDTGIDLFVGNTVSISAAGYAKSNSGNADNEAHSPAGDTCPADPTPFLAQGLPCFALVGRIGGSGAFYVGTGWSGRTSLSGRLYLSFNDQFFPDNAGSWSVSITVSA